MSKSKYIGEFEFKASARMLYPYLNTADGLEKWFADNVNFDPRRNLIFIWNGEKVFAKKVGQRPNQYVKYEFFSKDGKNTEDPDFIEFKLDENELTQTSFLQIVDYSEIEDKEDMDELYGNLVLSLREIVGG
jgi:hypothetical protein